MPSQETTSSPSEERLVHLDIGVRDKKSKRILRSIEVTLPERELTKLLTSSTPSESSPDGQEPKTSAPTT